MKTRHERAAEITKGKTQYEVALMLVDERDDHNKNAMEWFCECSDMQKEIEKMKQHNDVNYENAAFEIGGTDDGNYYFTPDDLDKFVKRIRHLEGQAQEPVDSIGSLSAEVRTIRDITDEYESFLVLVSDGKSQPYMHIPGDIDDGVLDEALRKLNAPMPPASDDKRDALRKAAKAIKSAFYEGFDSYATNCIPLSDVNEEWEDSSAKQEYDAAIDAARNEEK